MSDISIRAPRRVIEGLVEQTNGRSVKLGGAWYDYGYRFEGDPLPKDASGTRVGLTLVDSKRDGRSYILAVEAIPAEDGRATSPEAASSEAVRPCSPEALSYARDLACALQINGNELDLLALVRFRKKLEDLSSSELSTLIVFLGGRDRSGRRGA